MTRAPGRPAAVTPIIGRRAPTGLGPRADGSCASLHNFGFFAERPHPSPGPAVRGGPAARGPHRCIRDFRKPRHPDHRGRGALGPGAPCAPARLVGLVSWSDLFDEGGDTRDFDLVVKRKGLNADQLVGAGIADG